MPIYSEDRPWGSFHVIDEEAGYKVRRIMVNPGGRLSLQSHRHRAEHWTVASGVATVTIGKSVKRLGPAQSVDIGKGEIHRLENDGTDIAVIVEVQFGDYLGEDDIVRYEDVYNRA